jgi:hypothetical protein
VVVRDVGGRRTKQWQRHFRRLRPKCGRLLEQLEWIEHHLLPSGSGIDCGTAIDYSSSTDKCLVLTCAFHHMNDVGNYSGWTRHKIIVTPSLSSGIKVHVTGEDQNGVKEYLYEVYYLALIARYTEIGRNRRQCRSMSASLSHDRRKGA